LIDPVRREGRQALRNRRLAERGTSGLILHRGCSHRLSAQPVYGSAVGARDFVREGSVVDATSRCLTHLSPRAARLYPLISRRPNAPSDCGHEKGLQMRAL
jgi:hypothetical protein